MEKYTIDLFIGRDKILAYRILKQRKVQVVKLEIINEKRLLDGFKTHNGKVESSCNVMIVKTFKLQSTV